MTRFDVAVLSFRLLAVYILFWALWNGIELVGIAVGHWADRSTILPSLVLLAMYSALGAFLFSRSPLIARSLFRGDEPMSTANRPEIGALALKVCGVLLIAECITRSGGLFESSSSFGSPLASTLLTGGCGAVLFFAAPWLARRVFGAPVNPIAAPLLAHVQAVTFSVLGIWLLVSALAGLAGSVRDYFEFDGFGREIWTQLAGAALGLSLFLGGAGLARLWSRIQHAGLAPR